MMTEVWRWLTKRASWKLEALPVPRDPGRAGAWSTLFISALAITPRIIDLGVFRIIDEDHLWEWTQQFTQAVLARDWAGTAITAYPGLPFFWVQFVNLGLEMLRRTFIQGEWIGDAGVYLVFHEWNRETFLSERRFMLGLVNALLVVCLYLLVRRLFGEKVGLTAGILLALDPFLLSESRVARVEALSAEFVGLAVLTLLIYFRGRNWRWLALSGILGGLAVSTKSQNLLLVGFAGLALAAYWLWRGRREGWGRSLARMVPSGLFWLFVAVLAFVVIWPAMWVDPRVAFRLITDYASTHATDPEFQELYFLGETVIGRDPGALFYVVVFLWRMTPLALIGLVAALVWLGAKRQESPALWSRRAEIVTLLAFVVLYTAGMSVGASKRTRYLLPVFPVLDVIAAVGLVWLARIVVQRWLARWPARQLVGVGLGGILLVQSILVLPHNPYYYDFYNPLLGGGPVAAQLIRVGWGEGMDQAAAYLNTRPNPEQITAATRFGKYMVGFKGNTILLDTSWRWLHAQYIVFYIQQVQKMLEPSPGIIRYFQAQTPEHVVRLGGIDYAWIYANPIQVPADPSVSRIPGQAVLMGYTWQPVGDRTLAKVVWQNDGLNSDQAIAVRLLSADGESDWQVCQVTAASESAAQEVGEVAESLCSLPAVSATGGIGGLEFAVREATGSFTAFDFPLARVAVRFGEAGDISPLTLPEMYDAAARRALPPAAQQAGLRYGERIRLVGYELEPQSLRSGESLSVRLYWQALLPVDLDYQESVKLLDMANAPVGGIDRSPSLPTKSWWAGSVISDTLVLPVDAGVAPPAVLKLDVGLVYADTLQVLPAFDEAGQEVSRSIARVKYLPASWPQLEGVQRLSYTFGDSLMLEGMNLVAPAASPGGTLSLDLYWSVVDPASKDYTVFIHMLDEKGQLVGQADGPPVDGHYPTSAWSAGEVILDRHIIPVPDQVAPGRYVLMAGLYDASDGTRLPVMSADGKTTDAIALGEVYVR
jgi:4-amino-4-deoxy-L-arabinose transferase-like glycosyltransferase